MMKFGLQQVPPKQLLCGPQQQQPTLQARRTTRCPSRVEGRHACCFAMCLCRPVVSLACRGMPWAVAFALQACLPCGAVASRRCLLHATPHPRSTPDEAHMQSCVCARLQWPPPERGVHAGQPPARRAALHRATVLQAVTALYCNATPRHAPPHTHTHAHLSEYLWTSPGRTAGRRPGSPAPSTSSSCVGSTTIGFRFRKSGLCPSFCLLLKTLKRYCMSPASHSLRGWMMTFGLRGKTFVFVVVVARQAPMFTHKGASLA